MKKIITALSFVCAFSTQAQTVTKIRCEGSRFFWPKCEVNLEISPSTGDVSGQVSCQKSGDVVLFEKLSTVNRSGVPALNDYILLLDAGPLNSKNWIESRVRVYISNLQADGVIYQEANLKFFDANRKKFKSMDLTCLPNWEK